MEATSMRRTTVIYIGGCSFEKIVQRRHYFWRPLKYDGPKKYNTEVYRSKTGTCVGFVFTRRRAYAHYCKGHNSGAAELPAAPWTLGGTGKP